MALANRRLVTKLSQATRTLDPSATLFTRSCTGYTLLHHHGASPRRSFVTTPQARFAEKDYFAIANDSEKIRITPPAWHHPIYTEEQMNAIHVAHRDTKQWSDKVALMVMRFFRFGMDTATGYSHPNEEARKRGWTLGLTRMRSWFGPSPMTERKWLIRFLFLESVAGVPGMVAASLRHLHSLRRLKRDNGWSVLTLPHFIQFELSALQGLKHCSKKRTMRECTF